MYATLNRSLVDAHHLTLNDVRLLDMLDKSPTGSARMGDLADGLMSLPSRVTRQIRRLETAGPGAPRRQPRRRRGVLASITEEGREAVSEAMADVRRRGCASISSAELSRPQIAAMGENCRRISVGLKTATPPATGPRLGRRSWVGSAPYSCRRWRGRAA